MVGVSLVGGGPVEVGLLEVGLPEVGLPEVGQGAIDRGTATRKRGVRHNENAEEELEKANEGYYEVSDIPPFTPFREQGIHFHRQVI